MVSKMVKINEDIDPVLYLWLKILMDSNSLLDKNHTLLRSVGIVSIAMKF